MCPPICIVWIVTKKQKVEESVNDSGPKLIGLGPEGPQGMSGN